MYTHVNRYVYTCTTCICIHMLMYTHVQHAYIPMYAHVQHAYVHVHTRVQHAYIPGKFSRAEAPSYIHTQTRVEQKFTDRGGFRVGGGVAHIRFFAARARVREVQGLGPRQREGGREGGRAGRRYFEYLGLCREVLEVRHSACVARYLRYARHLKGTYYHVLPRTTTCRLPPGV